MGMLAVRKSVYDNLNNTQKAIVRWTCSRLQLGEPSLYTSGSVTYYVFQDYRIDLDDIAVAGVVAANIASLANNPNPPEGAQLRQAVRDYVAATIVWPSSINYTEAGNPWMETLAAQGAPNSVKADAGVPDSWQPVTT